tara:strand:- start:3432 stop:5126 length:1695 start_codon:yes stop_codon:yes gene_type:complete
MKRRALLEQQEKIKKMFSYKPGQTITENDKTYNKKWLKPINEIAPAVVAGAVGWGLTAVWAGYEIWKWGVNTWGSKTVSTRLRAAGNPDTWPAIQSSIKKTSIALGEDISGKLQVRSDKDCRTIADYLYQAMDGPGTYENNIRKGMDLCSTYMDLAKVANEYGVRENYTLYGWLDDELSQTYFDTYVVSPMQSKPLLVWDGKQYNDLETWAVELTKLVKDKEAQPGKDDARKNTIINSLAGKKGECMREYFKDAVVKYDVNDEPYLEFVDGDTTLSVFPNGRFMKDGEMGTIQKCEEDVVTESVKDILKLDWVLGGSLSEQLKIIMDKDKTKVITIRDKEIVDTGGEVDDEVDAGQPKSGDPVKSKPKWTLYTAVPTENEPVTYMRQMHYNKAADSNVRKVQVAIGAKDDGMYGKDTKAAVMKWQKENGLKVDGVIGPESWAKITETETVETGGETTEVVDNVAEKVIEKKVTEYVNIPKENVPTEREGLEKLVFDTEGNKKMQKNNCQNLIAFERGMLRSNMAKATDLKALGRCYDNHNFGWGGISKKVRKAYKLKTSKNNLG